MRLEGIILKVSICFSTTNSLPSKVIRWLTKANISHSYLKVYDQTFGTNLVLHADFDGIQIDLFDKFSINNFTVVEYEIDDPRLDEAIKKNLWYLGKSYDYKKLFNFAWAVIFKRWFIRKIKDPISNPRSLICVDFILYAINYSKICKLPIGYMYTNEFESWCFENHESLGWKRTTFDDTPKWLK